jgi:glycosyltransferase involved in cell wall biosynthesis
VWSAPGSTSISTQRVPFSHSSQESSQELTIRHALFVAYHFPPEASSSGVLRTLKFARYLVEYGWRVTVITPEISAYSVTDEGLLRQVPDLVRIVRTRYLNTKRHLSIRGRYSSMMALPDQWIGWLPWAVAEGRTILRSDPIDLVYSTSPHATAHLIAWQLARASSKPWVVDFRDPWFQDTPDVGDPSGPIYRYLNRSLERGVVKRSSQVVTSTVQLRDLMRNRYADQLAEKIVTIMNGYDEADFLALPPESSERDAKLTIVHAGRLHPAHRDPRPLLRALRRAGDDGRLDETRITVRFVGAGPYSESEDLRQCLLQTRLESHVEFLPRVPYDQALRELGKGDLLLLLQGSDDTAGLIPAKLYEYLRSQKPVLAAVFPGATNEVLRETGGGWAVDSRDEAALASVLAEVYLDWIAGRLQNRRANLGKLRRYDRRNLTAELAAIFDRLTHSLPQRASGH